jgi:hypothetical protein
MCGVIHRNLGKGAAARPRCIPHAGGAPSASSLIAPQKRPPFHPLRRSVPAPPETHPDQALRRWTTTRRRLRSPLDPIDQRRLPPLEPCTKFIAPGRDQGPSSPWTLILPKGQPSRRIGCASEVSWPAIRIHPDREDGTGRTHDAALACGSPPPCRLSVLPDQRQACGHRGSLASLDGAPVLSRSAAPRPLALRHRPLR